MIKREDIINACDVATEVVDVPEWGGEVTVRGFTLELRDKLIRREGDKLISNAQMLSYCLIDEAGKQMFSFDEADSMLGKKHPAVVDRLLDVVLRLSGMYATAVEDAEKN